MNKLVIVLSVLGMLTLGGFIFMQTTEDEPAVTNQPASSETTNKLPQGAETTLGDEPQSGQVMVDIRNFSYNPETITIKRGTTITWTNQDGARHDITPNSPDETFVGSELLSQGESHSFTFDVVGTYTYFCSPHPYMTGTVEVVE